MVKEVCQPLLPSGSPDATPDSRADVGPYPRADADPRGNVHHPDSAAAPDLPPLTTNATTQRPAYHPGP